MKNEKRKVCFNIDTYVNDSSIEHMSNLLQNEINEQVAQNTHDSKIEGFDCDEICTGKPKTNIYESNESKNIMLIFGLIVFYYAATHL